MMLRIGDGVSYVAEYFRFSERKFKRLEREGHGYIVGNINNEYVHVFNGIRTCIVHREDIIINHRSGKTR